MRAPTFTEKLLAYHTRFERHLLLLKLHGKDRTEDIPPGRPAESPPSDDPDERPEPRKDGAEPSRWH